jgi:hypothetical protein
MRIAEILYWNNEPIANRSEPQLRSSPTPFSVDPTNLANAFTRSGLVKHFWNLSGSAGQPSGPAPPDAETDVTSNGTSEPSAASWQAEPVEPERAVGQHRLVPFRQGRGVSQRRQRRCEQRHEVGGRPFETIGCPSCSSASTMM